MSRSTCTIILVALFANVGFVKGQFPWPSQSSQQTVPSGDPDPSDIIGGLTDAFFGNSITGSERRCMSSAASELTNSLSDTATSAMQTYKTFSGQAAVAATPVAAPVVAAPVAPAPMSAAAPAAGAAPIAASPVMPAAAVTEGEETVIAMQLAASISNLYKMEEQLGKSCLNDDVVSELQKAGDHLTDMSYVGGQLTANGVDVVNEMSDAFTAFENGNYRAFGKDMGTAWRKVLISKPESVEFAEPSAADIEEVTEGLFSSFFGPGFGLEVVTDSIPAGVAAAAPPAQPPQVLGAAAVTSPSLPAWAPQPGRATVPGSPVVQTNSGPASATNLQTVPQQSSLATIPPTTVDVDLHKCITKNLPLWKSAWSPVFQLVESSATLRPSEAPEMSDLMMAMMDVQLATTNCGIDPTEEAMLFDAFETGKLKTKLDVPENEQFQGAGFASLLSSALEDLQDRRWHAFGSQIGDAMQDLVVVGFAEKYEVDDGGRLRKKILGASELAQTDLQKSSWAVSGLFGVISVSFLLFVTMVGFRSRQTIVAFWCRSTAGAPQFDRLNGSDLEALIE